MFRIEYIQLNQQDPIRFGDATFVYGENSIGKTVLFKTIYYMLGHSDETGKNDFWLQDGLQNVDYITCKIKNDNRVLFLQRTSTHDYYFKQAIEEKFVLVNRKQYILKIQSFLDNAKNQYFDLYREATGEDLSFRGFVYMNFIDEYSLGLVNCVYRTVNDVSMYTRVHDQMAFLFDKERLLRIVELRKEIEEKEKTIASYNFCIEKELYLRSTIRDLFDKLKLNYSDSMIDNKNTFKGYLENNFSEKVEKNEKDLMFLLTMSAEIENQINSLKIYSLQTKKMEENFRSENILLNFYKSILVSNDEYIDYVKAIENQIEENTTNASFLETKDDEQTLELLQQKKKVVDEKICRAKQMLAKTNYIQRQVWIDSLQSALDDYDSLSDLGEYETIQKEIILKKSTLKAEEKLFKGSINKDLNSSIMEKYQKLMDKNIEFVKEDFKQSDFELWFIPSTMSIIAKRNITSSTKASSSYNAGSKARLTVWQLFTCLSIVEFIKKHFEGFPILPLLVIDGIHEPFDDAGVLEKVYDQLKISCEKSGIQLIVMSARKLVGTNPCDIDINNGLNKEFYFKAMR